MTIAKWIKFKLLFSPHEAFSAALWRHFPDLACSELYVSAQNILCSTHSSQNTNSHPTFKICPKYHFILEILSPRPQLIIPPVCYCNTLSIYYYIKCLTLMYPLPRRKLKFSRTGILFYSCPRLRCLVSTGVRAEWALMMMTGSLSINWGAQPPAQQRDKEKTLRHFLRLWLSTYRGCRDRYSNGSDDSDLFQA